MRYRDNRHIIALIIAFVIVAIGIFGLIAYIKNQRPKNATPPPIATPDKEIIPEKKEEVEKPKSEQEEGEKKVPPTTTPPTANAAGPVVGPMNLPSNVPSNPSGTTNGKIQQPTVFKMPVSGPEVE